MCINTTPYFDSRFLHQFHKYLICATILYHDQHPQISHRFRFNALQTRHLRLRSLALLSLLLISTSFLSFFLLKLYIRTYWCGVGVIKMGSGDKSGHLNFHLHMPQIHLHHGGSGRRGIPRGCVAITVGQGAEQQRFVIPVMYVNHPLFTELLKEAEEEYGFDQKGPINIPCHVEEFRQVRGLIDKDATSHHHIHVHHHHHHHHQFLCFKA